MAVQFGAMTFAQLDKYIRGWGKKSLELINLDIQVASPLDKAFPTQTVDIQRLEFFTVHGNPGQLDVELESPPVMTRWNMTRVTKDIKIQKFSYEILDSTKANVYVDTLAADGTNMALKFFGAVHTYKLINEMASYYGNTATPSAYWNADGGNPEGDIMTGLETIMYKTGTNPESSAYGLVFPSKVMSGINQLDLIHNVQQNLKDYLKDAWNITWYPYTPYMDADGNQYLDIETKTASNALLADTSYMDAFMFLEGTQTMKAAQYIPPANVPMSETTRVHDHGWVTTLRHGYDCKVVPKYSSTTTPHIYRFHHIVGV